MIDGSRSPLTSQRPSPQREVIRFGAFELDARAGELRKHGVRIRLQNKPFRILELLLANPGHVVTRDELRAELWPENVFVDFDHGLNSAVNKLREALFDSAAQPRFIETTPRGYRFIGHIELPPAPAPPLAVTPDADSPSDVLTTTVQPARAERRPTWWKPASLGFAAAAVLLVAMFVTSQLGTRHTSQQPSVAVRPASATVDPVVYEAYLKGRYFVDRGAKPPRAVGYFGQAIAADPTYAPAYAGLADAHGQTGWALSAETPPEPAYRKALAAAQQALKLDAGLASAHVALGRVRWKYEFDFRAAEEAFTRAIELDPHSAVAYESYFDLLSAMGRHSEAYGRLSRAAELDPISVTINYDFGLHFTRTGEYGRAVEWLRKAIELDPASGFVHHLLGEAYADQGNPAQAAIELQRAIELSEPNPHYVAVLAVVQRQAGDSEAPRRALSLLEQRGRQTYVSPHSLAMVHASIGNVNQALDLLERAYEQRDPWLSLIHVQSQFNALRGIPRFKSLLQRMGLGDERSMKVPILTP